MAIITLYLYINQTITKLQIKILSHEKQHKNDSNDSLPIIKTFYRATTMGIGIISTLWSIGLIFQETILLYLCCIYQGIVGTITCSYFTIIFVKLKQRLLKKENEYYVYRSSVSSSPNINNITIVNQDRNENEDEDENKNSNFENKCDKCIICHSLFIVTLLTTLWTFRMVAMIQRIALGSRAPPIGSSGEHIIFIYQIIYGLINNTTLFTVVHSNSNSNSMMRTNNNGRNNGNSNKNNNKTNTNNNNTIIDDQIDSVSVTSKRGSINISGTIATTSEMNNDDQLQRMQLKLHGGAMQTHARRMDSTRRNTTIDTIGISNIPGDLQRETTLPASYFSQKHVHFQNHNGHVNVNADLIITDIKNNNNNNVLNQSNVKPIISCMARRTRSVPTSRSQLQEKRMMRTGKVYFLFISLRNCLFSAQI